MERKGLSQLQDLQERTKRWHDKRIKHKEFKAGDKVLLFNSRVKLFEHGKLRSKWDGPLKVVNTSNHGAITIQDDSGNNFKVNGQHLKIYFEPQINMVEEFDVIEFIEFSH
jgi:hypothetical protein